MIDPTAFFDSIREYDKSADNEESKGHTRFATVDSNYSGSGPARVMFDGEQTLSTKAYHFIQTPPPANVRVCMLPVGNTYVILGAVNGGV